MQYEPVDKKFVAKKKSLVSFNRKFCIINRDQVVPHKVLTHRSSLKNHVNSSPHGIRVQASSKIRDSDPQPLTVVARGRHEHEVQRDNLHFRSP